MPAGELSRIFETAAEDGSPLPSDAIPLGIALLQGRPAHRRFRLRGLDGIWRLIDTTAFPVVGQEGRHLGAVAIFWEATDG